MNAHSNPLTALEGHISGHRSLRSRWRHTLTTPLRPSTNRVRAVYKDSQPASFLSFSLGNPRFFMRESQRAVKFMPTVTCCAHCAMHFGGTLWGTFWRGQTSSSSDESDVAGCGCPTGPRRLGEAFGMPKWVRYSTRPWMFSTQSITRFSKHFSLEANVYGKHAGQIELSLARGENAPSAGAIKKREGGVMYQDLGFQNSHPFVTPPPRPR